MSLIKRTAERDLSAWSVDRRSTDIDVPELIRDLRAADADVRRCAALDLEGVIEAVPALLARVAPEADTAVRETVLTVLAAHDCDEVAAGLAPFLASDDAVLRNAVVDALSAMPRSMPGQVPILLASDDSDVRVLTVMILAALRVPEVPIWLADVVRCDPHSNVVSAALAELLETGGDEVIELARAASVRFPEDPFLRFVALSSLARGTS